MEKRDRAMATRDSTMVTLRWRSMTEPWRMIGSRCSGFNSDNCKLVKHVECVKPDGATSNDERKCQCINGFYKSADNSSCIEVIGSNCKEQLSDNCNLVNHLKCTKLIDSDRNERTCQCINGFYRSIDNRSCVEECKPPLFMLNKNIHFLMNDTDIPTGTFFFEDKLIYMCNEGYEFIPNAADTANRTIECQSNRSWSGFEQCKRRDCGNLELLNISNAERRHKFNDTKYRSNATISCDTGYTDQNKPHTLGISTTWIKCSASGTWEHVPNCVRKDCGNVRDIIIENAANRRLHKDTMYNSTADIDCDEGYYNINDTQSSEISTTTIRCSENGTWKNIPKCVRKDCGKLDLLKISNVKSRHKFNDTKYQSNATISCDTGYTDQNKPQTLGISTTWIKCSASGTWENVPNCVRKDCGSLELLNISNAERRHKFNDTKYQSNATISCDTGYTDQNKPHTLGISTTWIKCSASGTWDNVPNCVRKDCGDVHDISIGNAANRRLHKDTMYNSTADIDCDEGYYNINDTQSSEISTTTIRCSENGTWKNIPKCVRKDCGKLDLLKISNAERRHKFNDTKYRSNATISCDTGYTDQNKPHTLGISTTWIKCSASGTWGNVPNCVRK
ncbi:P-selectin-like, partial [Mercenaria mercenaria]|uniref:P-selectin-like n=1 Tax=Mercenaria mercenaria TaxID=6596 RepID=UPI00234EB4D0